MREARKRGQCFIEAFLDAQRGTKREVSRSGEILKKKGVKEKEKNGEKLVAKKEVSTSKREEAVITAKVDKKEQEEEICSQEGDLKKRLNNIKKGKGKEERKISEYVIVFL